jgi:predicted glycosyltransferase
VVGAVWVLYRHNGMVSIHFYIATALGIGATMLLTSALMGLLFLSHGTGHDDVIVDKLEEERNR